MEVVGEDDRGNSITDSNILEDFREGGTNDSLDHSIDALEVSQQESNCSQPPSISQRDTGNGSSSDGDRDNGFNIVFLL